jgi:AcrR family transcriptional regulator
VLANETLAATLNGANANGANGQRRGAKLDPRVRRTRQLLQAAFMALLGEKRFEAITVQDIAERATVNRATFYAHFVDKYALLEYTVREEFATALAAHLPADAALSAENLHRLIVIVCQFVVQLHGHCVPSPLPSQVILMVEAQVQEQVREVLLAWLTAAQPSSVQGATADPALAATVTSWAIYGVAQQWARGDRHMPPEQWARQALPLVLAPIRVGVQSAL